VPEYDDVPQQRAINLEAFRTASAVAEFAVYRLHPDEEYIFPKYYRAGERLLDLACGMGRTTLILHEMGLVVKGVDQSPVFIETAQRRFPYLSFEIGSYDHIEEPDESFDHVLISFNGIDYAFPLTQRMTALRESIRVLKPGGTLIYSSHNLKSLHWFSPYYRDQLRWKLANCHKAFKDWDYIVEAGVYTFYGSRECVIRQAEELGLKLLESRGFARFSSQSIDEYFSPYILYVLKKPAR
jgi:ubiquinone/menaquinone biosynthesis C-methylase UbiE